MAHLRASRRGTRGPSAIEGSHLDLRRRLEAALAAQFGAERSKAFDTLSTAWEATPPTRREMRLAVPKGPKYPDDFYRKVADLYVRLAPNGRRPAVALADANPSVPITTVHAWIKTARARRFLAPARKGGATG